MRSQKKEINARNVVDLLLFSRDFPRSVRYCVERVDASLHGISGTPRGSFTSDCERVSGRLLADLNYGAAAGVFGDRRDPVDLSKRGPRPGREAGDGDAPVVALHLWSSAAYAIPKQIALHRTQRFELLDRCFRLLLLVANRAGAFGHLRLEHRSELLDRRRPRVAPRHRVEKLESALVVLRRVLRKRIEHG